MEARRADALQVLKQARQLAPEHPGVLLEAGRLLCEAGRWQEAQAALSTLVRLSPGSTPAYFLLGRAYRGLGDEGAARRAEATFRRRQVYEQRVQDLASRLGANPDSAELRFRIGELHAAEGELELAIRAYRNGLQREPENRKARARLSELVRRRLQEPADAAPR